MTEREEIELLLPWYATGKLEASEHERVETYLSAHDDLNVQLAAIHEDKDNVIAFNEQVKAPAAGGLDRLLARIDAEEPSAPQRATFMEAIQSLFGSLGSPGLKFAAAAMVVLVIGQAAMLTSVFTGPRQGAGYETASSGNSTAPPDLLVSFKPGTTVEQLNSLLEETELLIVGGPLPGGLYEVRLAAEDASAAQLDALIAKIEKRADLIQQVVRAE